MLKENKYLLLFIKTSVLQKRWFCCERQSLCWLSHIVCCSWTVMACSPHPQLRHAVVLMLLTCYTHSCPHTKSMDHVKGRKAIFRGRKHDGDGLTNPSWAHDTTSPLLHHLMDHKSWWSFYFQSLFLSSIDPDTLQWDIKSAGSGSLRSEVSAAPYIDSTAGVTHVNVTEEKSGL